MKSEHDTHAYMQHNTTHTTHVHTHTTHVHTHTTLVHTHTHTQHTQHTTRVHAYTHTSVLCCSMDGLQEQLSTLQKRNKELEVASLKHEVY